MLKEIKLCLVFLKLISLIKHKSCLLLFENVLLGLIIYIKLQISKETPKIETKNYDNQ